MNPLILRSLIVTVVVSIVSQRQEERADVVVGSVGRVDLFFVLLIYVINVRFQRVDELGDGYLIRNKGWKRWKSNPGETLLCNNHPFHTRKLKAIISPSVAISSITAKLCRSEYRSIRTKVS